MYFNIPNFMPCRPLHWFHRPVIVPAVPTSCGRVMPGTALPFYARLGSWFNRKPAPLPGRACVPCNGNQHRPNFVPVNAPRHAPVGLAGRVSKGFMPFRWH